MNTTADHVPAKRTPATVSRRRMWVVAGTVALVTGAVATVAPAFAAPGDGGDCTPKGPMHALHADDQCRLDRALSVVDQLAGTSFVNGQATTSPSSQATSSPAGTATGTATAAPTTIDGAEGPSESATSSASPSTSDPATASPSRSSSSSSTGLASVSVNGASGYGVASGSFSAMRGGGAVDAATTWLDNDCRQTGSLTQEYGSWNKPLIVAIGALQSDDAASQAAGRPVPTISWAEAAQGNSSWVSYERQCLTAIKAAWGNRPQSNLILSFAHEANENDAQPWYPWAVDPDQVEDFKTAEKLFRQMQQEILPDAKLAIVLNGDDGNLGNGESLLPDAADYDLVGVDFYAGHYAKGNKLETYTDMAQSHGKQLILQEWGFNAGDSDAKDYVGYMHQEFDDHAGTSAGQISVAVFFNANDQFAILNSSGQLSNNASGRDAYVSLFGGAS